LLSIVALLYQYSPISLYLTPFRKFDPHPLFAPPLTPDRLFYTIEV
jgi:hypothetical protein